MRLVNISDGKVEIIMKTNLEKSFLEYHVKRILIIGCPGAGKSTLSKELGQLLNIEVLHLDKIYWDPNWVVVDKHVFERKLDLELEKDMWIIDGNYNKTMEKRMARCDLIIYLDYDTQTCLQSYYERVSSGAVKEFITEGCIEEIDNEFIEFIKNYNKEFKEINYQRILSSKKNYIIFENRDEKNLWIDKLMEELF